MSKCTVTKQHEPQTVAACGRALLKSGGFTMTEVIPTRSPLSIIVGITHVAICVTGFRSRRGGRVGSERCD
jgi:hypothetical protein